MHQESQCTRSRNAPGVAMHQESLVAAWAPIVNRVSIVVG